MEKKQKPKAEKKEQEKSITGKKIPLPDIIVLVSIVLVMGILLYTLIIFLIGALSTYLFRMGIDLKSVNSVFWAITSTFIFVIILKYSFQSFLEPHFKNSKLFRMLQKNVNIYTILSFYLIIVIIVVGSGLISERYLNKMPHPIGFPVINFLHGVTNESYPLISPIECKSNSNFYDFVEGDRLNCGFNIQYFEDSSFTLSKIEVIRILSSGQNLSYSQNRFMIKPSIGYFYIGIIKGETAFDVWVYIYFENDENAIVEHIFNSKIVTMKREEYYTRESQKLPLLIAILTFASGSVIVFIRNLKEVIRNN